MIEVPITVVLIYRNQCCYCLFRMVFIVSMLT